MNRSQKLKSGIIKILRGSLVLSLVLAGIINRDQYLPTALMLYGLIVASFTVFFVGYWAWKNL